MFYWIKTRADAEKLTDYEKARALLRTAFVGSGGTLAGGVTFLLSKRTDLSADLARKSSELDVSMFDYRRELGRADAAEAELARIANQRRTAAAKGRETQRAKREAREALLEAMP